MAKTYYKYAKRETTPVDYAGAAKDLSEGLMATVTGLEKKAEKAAGEVAAAKSKIEEEFAKEEERKRKEDEALQKQYGDKVSRAADLPLSYQEDYKTVQSTILDLSSDAADLKAKLKRDYEAGKMTTKDYNRRVNNIRDQFKMMKQTAVTSLDMVNATNEAMQNGTALPIQHDMLTRILKGRFDSTNAQYNIDEEGNIFADITDPETGKVEQMSVYDMNKLSMQRFDVFDIDGQAESLVEDIGKVLENYRTSGMTTEQLLEKEVMQRGNEISTPMDYIKKNIDGYSDNQLASILQMKMSQDYKRSMNPADFGNDDVVVYTISPLSGQYEAKLTDNQKQAARDFATAAVLTQLNPLKKPATSGKAPSSAQIAAGKAKEKARGYVTALQDLFTAKDPNKRAAAMANLAGAVGQDKFISIEMNDSGDAIIFTGIDDEGNIRKPQQIPLEGTFDDFVKNYGKILTGTNDVWTYYDEVIDSPDVSSLTPSIGAGGKYEIGFEEDLSQKLTDLASIGNVLDIQPLATENYFRESSKIRDSKAYVQKFIEASQIKGLSYNVDNTKKMIISHPDLGTLPPIRLNRDSEIIASDLKEALYKMYEAATTGKPLEGTTEPADSAGGGGIDYSSK